jgi:DNA (cytosine-5)-methyltransferase 1
VVRPGKSIVLDLFCGEGGAAMGYILAGFDVIGIDLNTKTNPNATRIFNDTFEDCGGKAYELDWEAGLEKYKDEVQLIHASPPCQLYSGARGGRSSIEDEQGNSLHPDLIDTVRQKLEATNLPFVIENVGGARSKLHEPVMLCGCMFGLTTLFATPRDPTNKLAKSIGFKGEKKNIERDCGCAVYGPCGHEKLRPYGLYRKRYFETGGWELPQLRCEDHTLPNMPVTTGNPSSFYYVNGSFPIGVEAKQRIMETWWMTHRGTAEAIPPQFTRWIGLRFRDHLENRSIQHRLDSI